MYKDNLKSELAEFFGCSPANITLAWKGRVGLYGILKSLGVVEGDEVIVPAYTCVVVPNAIIYLGAKPIYVEIDPLTYNIDASKIEEAISPRTKVIIAQNTYGLSSDLDYIQEIASKYNLTVVDDCTHGFGGSYKGHKNGTVLEYAFFSSQWNKMFSTGLGGIMICTNKLIKEKLNQFESDLIVPSKKEISLLQLQLILKNIIGYSALYSNAVKLYRYLSSHNLMLGSSSGEEISSIKMPEEYLKGMSEAQAKNAVKEIKKIEENVAARRHVAKSYDTVLESIGIRPAYVPDYAGHTYTKYPILVKDQNEFRNKALAKNIPVHDWFSSPLYPITKDFEQWHFNIDHFPIAKNISKHIVNLPTDRKVSKNMLSRICSFLSKNTDLIMNTNEVVQ